MTDIEISTALATTILEENPTKEIIPHFWHHLAVSQVVYAISSRTEAIPIASVSKNVIHRLRVKRVTPTHPTGLHLVPSKVVHKLSHGLPELPGIVKHFL